MAERVTEIRQSRSSLAWFALAALPFLALVAWHWSLGPLAAFGDWSQYMLHADALYRGRAYTDIGYIFTNLNPFIGPRAQPPGLPATVAVLMAITGGTHDPTIYKLLMVAFALAFLACAFAYFRRRNGPVVAAAIVMVSGVWLETGFVTNVVQPDVGFCAFVWAIFCIADRGGAWRMSHVVAVTVLGLVALAYRVAALPLVPALTAYALIHRRNVGWRPLIPVAIWCACGLAAAIAVPGAFTFATLIALEPARLIRNIAESARVYPFAALDLYLYPFPWNRANDVYHLVLGVLAVPGAVDWFRRDWARLLTAFALFYIGMLVVLPMQDGRYLMPLAPLLLYAIANGGLVVGRWVASRVRRDATARGPRIVLTAAGAICALALITQMRQPPPAVLMEVPGVRSIFTLLRTEHDRSPVRAVFVNPRVLTWETGVPAMGFFTASADSTIAELRAQRITHVVVGDPGTDPFHAPSIAAAVTARPDAFRGVFAEGVFTVFRFDSTRAARP
jgi:hypothetical protein